MKKSHSFVVEFRRKRVVIDPRKIWNDAPGKTRSTREREIAWVRAQAHFSPASQRLPN